MLKTQEKKKKKKYERNRIGRSNYFVVKWPECSVFPVLTEGKELRAYEYNKLKLKLKLDQDVIHYDTWLRKHS